MGNLIKQKVLVVEDDLALQPFWDLVLNRCFKGPEIDWAVSGEQAKVLVHTATEQGMPFDLVISDIFLAGAETGLDLMSCQELAESSAAFILVSVAEEEKIKDHFTNVVCESAVMTKPLQAQLCEDTINRIFETRRAKGIL